MGRRVPYDNISLIHPFIYLSFFAASFAATIAIITAICSVRFRRKSHDAQQLNVEKDLNKSNSPTNAVTTGESVSPQHENEKSSLEKTEQKAETENNEFMIKELPLPPAMLQPKEPFSSQHMKRVTSERRASFSLNVKKPNLPRSLSLAKNWDHQKEDKNKTKIKTEGSVWKKTIILGEKCVPDNEDDPIIFEGKGKKILAYHPKSYSTISRQCSFIDPDALCVSQTQTQEDRNNNNI